MAVNPLARTGDQNTLKMSDLLRIPVRDRVTAAKTDSSFIQMILSSLRPIEVAKAFPSYYRDAIPDVSNFVTKNIEAKLSAGGMTWNQRGGGNQGTARPGYSGESKTSPNTKPAGERALSVDEIKKKLMEKGIDVDNLHETVGTQGILANDKRSKFLKNASNEKLAKMGFERFETEEGKNMIRVKPFDVEAMTDEEISKKISGKVVAKETATETQKAIIDFANRWGISPEAAAGVFNVESRVTNSATNGSHHGIFQLNTDQVDDLSEEAGFGRLTPAQFRKLSISDQLKVMDKYYEYWKVKPDFFTGDPKTDTAKMWALQFAPGNAKKIDYTNPNVQITGPGQAAEVSAGGKGSPVTVGSSMGSLSGGIDYLGEAITRIEGTATPEQIEEYKREQRLSEDEKREEEAARYAYDLESPTSSEARVDKTGNVVLSDTSEQWGFEPGRNAEGTDPKLVAAMKLAAERFPLRVRFFSGTERGSGEHGAGMAGDAQIYDESGHPLSSYQDPRTMTAYAMYWQNVYDAAKELHGEEYANKLSWLGGDVRASGDAMPKLGESYNPNAYGTGDAMDIRYNRKGINYEEAFKVNEGWNPKYAFYTEGDYFGIGAKQGRYTQDDYAKLVGFRLTDTQKVEMAQRARDMKSNAGYFRRLEATGGVGIGERKLEGPQIVQEETEQTAEIEAIDQMSDAEIRQMYRLKLKQTYEDGMLTEEQYKKALNYRGDTVDDMREEMKDEIRWKQEQAAEAEEETESEVDKDNPYLSKSVEELRKMTSEQYDLKESILKKSGKMYYEDSDWLKADIEEKKMYDALREANRRESEKVEVQPDTETSTVDEEAPEMALGGFISEKDNLSVVNARGDTLAKINEGELNGGIRADGTGLRVVSNKTRIADDIVERNTMPSVTEQPEPETQEKPVEQKNQVMKDDQQWRESSMIDTSYSAGTQVRAFRRSKFMPEGYHFNRATPGSLA